MRIPFLQKSPPPPPPQDDEDVLDIDDVHAVDVSGLTEALRAQLTRGRYQPPMPPVVAMKVLELSRQPEIDVHQAAMLFSQDATLASRVLQIARSPLYGSAKVPTIKEAIVRLGSRRLHDVVLEAALEMRVFRSAQYGAWMESLRRHSVAVAHAARSTAVACGMNPEQAFFAGLVHDVGAAIVLGVVGDKKNSLGPAFQTLDRSALAIAMDELHVEVGGLLADAWQMPSDVKAVTYGHHTSPAFGMAPDAGLMLAVVIVAEAIATGCGYAIVADRDIGAVEATDDSVLQWALQTLGLDADAAQRLEAEVRPTLELMAAH